MAARSNFALQLELAELHRHHDRIPALFAWFCRERRQVTWDEYLGLASRVAAGDQF
jgi:hypothetical protein